MEITIPACLPEPTGRQVNHIESLLRKFGNARRRAYNIIRKKGMPKSEIVKRLQSETGLNSRYAADAYNSVKDLPSNVAFGGKRNQKLREKGKISREEFHRRRNCVLISRGDKTKNGNLNLRIVDSDGGLKLRINVGNREWIYPDLYVPKKYLKKYGHLLDGSEAYQVVITRKDGHLKEYEVKITVRPEIELPEKDRIMALDINSGHIDWAVMDRKDRELVETGRIDCHEVLDASSNKTENLLYELARKIGNIAEHYDAEVVAGNLNTGEFSSSSEANRKVKQMPQLKLRQILSYKLPLRGIPFKERSEVYTSVIGQYLCKPLGLDVHKGSAYALGIKVLDRELFSNLRGLLLDDGDGIRRDGESGGCGPTAPDQSEVLMKRWSAMSREARLRPDSLVGAARYGF